MPAIDQCEPRVIRALHKQGWIITHHPYAIRMDRTRSGYIYADLQLRQIEQNRTIIVVEVKRFESTRTLLEEFYQAVGQYVVYRNALSLNSSPVPVYLAVPLDVYDTFFQKPLIQSVVNDMEVSLVVIDLEQEEVAGWSS